METDHTNSPLSSAAVLRLRAEERMGSKTPEEYLPQSQEATRRIVHELEVHQIELVMQNEELRQARYEVETALKMYTDLYEFAPVGYFTLDRSGMISALNLAAADLLKIERSLLIGRSFEQLISEEFRPAFSVFLQSVFTGMCAISCEMILLNNVNLPINVQIGATVCSLEKECRLALIDISGQRETLQQKESKPVNNDLATIEKSSAELELCEFSLREALLSSLLILKEKALKDGREIHLNLAPEVDERIVADQGKLKQIIFNLLSNAVISTPAGRTIEVSAAKKGDHIIFTVADSDTTINNEVVQKPSEPCTAQESVIVNEGDCTSLILTRQLVEHLGGRIRVENGFEAGNRYCFTIPFRDCMGTI
jgi:signal transduction histidine kinase